MLSVSYVLFATCTFAGGVLAHGQIHHVSSGGKTMNGPNIYFAGDKVNQNTPVRVMYKASGPAFVLPSGFKDENQMSCEGSANSPAPVSIPVAAGDSLDIFWAGATGELTGQGGVTAYHPWVHSMGPVIDYITSCKGPCNKFNSLNAGWTKLAEGGIDFGETIEGSLRAAMTRKPEKYFPTSGKGLWAMAKLVQDGSKWSVNIPKDLAPGEYIIRNELAAIHNPLTSNPTSGPQVYISCTQIKVTGSGSKTLPAGTKASQLYDPNGAFAKFNVYSQDSHSFQLPGPKVWDGVSSSSSSDSDSDESNDKSSDDTPTPKPKPKPTPYNSTTNTDPEGPSPKTCKHHQRRSVKREAVPVAVPNPEAIRYHRARRSHTF